jgi:hypothetical protein
MVAPELRWKTQQRPTWHEEQNSDIRPAQQKAKQFSIEIKQDSYNHGGHRSLSLL